MTRKGVGKGKTPCDPCDGVTCVGRGSGSGSCDGVQWKGRTFVMTQSSLDWLFEMTL